MLYIAYVKARPDATGIEQLSRKWWNDGARPDGLRTIGIYGCIGTDLYTDVGVHETVAKLSTMWQYGKVAWDKKRTLYQLVEEEQQRQDGSAP